MVSLCQNSLRRCPSLADAAVPDCPHTGRETEHKGQIEAKHSNPGKGREHKMLYFLTKEADIFF